MVFRIELRKVGEGRQAEIYDWAPGLVLKLYKDGGQPGRARRELEATRAAHALGAPVPACKSELEIQGREGLLLEALQGPVMGEAILGGDVVSLGHQLGVMHATLHQKSGRGFPALVDGMRRRATEAVPADLVPGVQAAFDRLPDGSSLIHGDVHPYNVMWNGKRWLTIDWPGAYSGHPGAGVTRTLFLLTEAAYLEPVPLPDARTALAEAYLRGYRSVSKMTDEMIDAWRVPVIAARLAEPIPEEYDYLVGCLRES